MYSKNENRKKKQNKTNKNLMISFESVLGKQFCFIKWQTEYIYSVSSSLYVMYTSLYLRKESDN